MNMPFKDLNKEMLAFGTLEKMLSSVAASR